MKNVAGLPTSNPVMSAVLNENDVLVMECPGSVTKEQSDEIFGWFDKAFPGVKVLILPNGMRMNIIKADALKA